MKITIKEILIGVVSAIIVSIIVALTPIFWPTWKDDISTMWTNIQDQSALISVGITQHIWQFTTIVLVTTLAVIVALFLYNKFNNTPDFKWYSRVCKDDDGKESAFLIWFPMNRKYTSPTLRSSADFNVDSIMKSVVIKELITHRFITVNSELGYSITINEKAYHYFERLAKKHIIDKNAAWLRNLIKSDFRIILNASIEPRVGIKVYRKKI